MSNFKLVPPLFWATLGQLGANFKQTWDNFVIKFWTTILQFEDQTMTTY